MTEFLYVDARRVFWVGPLTIVTSVIAVLAVREVAMWMIHPPPRFEPLTVGPPIFDTILGCVGAILVFACLDSVRTYRRVAAVVLILSFIPDVLLATSHEMGATWPEAFFLMTMHVVVWAICVTLLPGLSMTRSVESTVKPENPLSIKL
jgi:hypothetical protein